WQSFGSNDFDYMPYGNYGSEDSSAAIGSLFSEAKSSSHLTVQFEDESGSESFEEFAPQYFKYLTDSLNSGSPTCLAKIVGIYQVIVKHLRSGKETKMHLMVMENLFFKKSISWVYDLKGSARSRYNSDMTGTNKTLLHMNLLEALRTNPISVGGKAKRNLERAVWNDTSFLA
nr:putative 1-phosphatidylinositol-3-phosphate 5-kinase FAB1C [Tanacetum cinerariifolium]